MQTLFLTILGLIIMIPIISLLVIPTALWRAYVLSILWGWFVVPTFNLPELGIITAMGISLIVGLFSYSCQETKDNENQKKYNYNYLASSLITPLIILIVGYIISYWM